MAAVLSNEISNTDKIAVFTSDCAALKIRILPPDVNKSGLVFQPERTNGRRAIRYGLAAIKNVGEGPMRLALAEREANGPFKSPEDFADAARRPVVQQAGPGKPDPRRRLRFHRRGPGVPVRAGRHRASPPLPAPRRTGKRGRGVCST